MNNVKVTIIVPTYNNEKYIEKCINSLLEQTYKNLEILVIDDGSNDLTPQIVDLLASKDKRLKVIHKKNEGVSIARNIGIEMSNGNYLIFVDGDDYVEKSYIYDLVKKAEENDLDLVITGLKQVDTDGNVINEIVPKSYSRFYKEEWVFKLSIATGHLYKRKLWQDNDIRFYEDKNVRGEDLPIALYFSAVCDKIDVLPKNDYFYVQHSASAMQNFRGLKKYKLPYEAIEQAIVMASKKGICNSEYNFELFVFRILATFISLAKGSSKEQIKELKSYISHIVKSYFPNYEKNPLLKLNNKVEVPFFQKLAVYSLAIAIKTNTLGLLIKVSCI